MSDTPLSKLLKQGSSLTSYNIGQVAKLEAQIAALTAELSQVKAELAKEQSFVHALKGLHAGDIETLKADRDTALKRLNTITKSAYLAGDGWRIGAAFPAVGPHKLSGLSKDDFYAAVDAAREG